MTAIADIKRLMKVRQNLGKRHSNQSRLPRWRKSYHAASVSLSLSYVLVSISCSIFPIVLPTVALTSAPKRITRSSFIAHLCFEHLLDAHGCRMEEMIDVISKPSLMTSNRLSAPRFSSLVSRLGRRNVLWTLTTTLFRSGQAHDAFCGALNTQNIAVSLWYVLNPLLDD